LFCRKFSLKHSVVLHLFWVILFLFYFILCQFWIVPSPVLGHSAPILLQIVSVLDSPSRVLGHSVSILLHFVSVLDSPSPALVIPAIPKKYNA